MPTFSYKGYDFEVDHTPTEDEFAQMSAHVDTLPPKEATGPSLLDKATGVGQAAASVITSGLGLPIGFLAAGLQKMNDPSNINFEKQTAANMQAVTYEPSRPLGQEYADTVGKLFNDVGIPAIAHLGGVRLPSVGEMGIQAKVNLGRDIPVPKGVESALAELKAPEPVKEPSKAPLGEQGNLFSQHEEAMGKANQFQAELTDGWRTDENGIPIRADLSMEVQNLENPLQRNLFGDELGPALGNERSLTEAIDTMPNEPWKGSVRDEALGRLQGAVEAPPELAVAKMEADGAQLQPERRVPKSQKGAVLFDWGSNNKVDKLRGIPGIGERLKDVGNALIKSPDEAVELAKAAPDVNQNSVQKGINQLTKGGIYMKGKVDNPVVHFTVDRFLEGDNKAKAEISQKLHGAYLHQIRSLPTKEFNFAAALLNSADLHRKVITPDFMERHGFSEPLKHFINLHNEMMADVLGKINKAREMAGKRPITAREAYSAMNMTGDFRKVAYKVAEEGNKEVVGVIGANSKSIGKHSLSKLEALMKAKDPSLEFGPLQDMSSSNKSLRGTPHEAFSDALKILGDDNPNIKAFLDTLSEVAKDDPYNYLGMQKHTLTKKGVWGMEGRKPWLNAEENARAFFENQVKYMESAYNWSHLSEAARDVNDVLRHPEVVGKQENAIKLSEQYMQNALGINPSRVGKSVDGLFNSLWGSMGVGPSVPRNAINMARRFANTTLLSLNPSFLAIQLLQVPTVVPGITAFLRSRGVAPARTMFTQGFDYLMKGQHTYMKEAIGKELSPVEKGALQFAKDNHVYASDMVEHTNQTRKGVGYYTSKITQSPGATVEKGTRAQVFMSLVHMMDEAGLKTSEGLYEQAQRFTDQAMNHFGSLEKPQAYNALGPFAEMAYNLKSFGHNEISRWSEYARDIGNTKNPVPLLTQMATTIAFAGVLGLPFMSQWESLYDFITKKIGKPRSLALDIMDASQQVGASLGEKGKYVLSHGLFTMNGIDMSKRIGLGDVLPNNAADAAFAGGGKLASMVGSVAGAIVNPSAETAQAAAFNLAPPIAQGPMDVGMYQKGDIAFSKDPDKLKPVAERTEMDTLLRKIGLRGISESTQKERNFRQGEIDKAYTEYRKSAMNTLAQDLFRDRPMSSKAIEKYFVTGQGDPDSFVKEFMKMAQEQQMSPEQTKMLFLSAAKQIPQLQALARRVQ